MNAALNLAVFQAVWLAVVLGVAHGWPWAGVGLLTAWLPFHFGLSRTAREDLLLAAVLGSLGPLLDTALMHAGLVGFKGPTFVDGLAPAWLFALWINFALTLNHALRWIGERPILAASFGAVGGPLAYYAGARLGVAQFSAPLWQPLAALACIWGVTLLMLAGLQQSRPRFAKSSP